MESAGSKGLGSASKTRARASWRSRSERGVERGEPREPRGVETLCVVGLATSADQEGKKSNTTSNIQLKSQSLSLHNSESV